MIIMIVYNLLYLRRRFNEQQFQYKKKLRGKSQFGALGVFKFNENY